MKKFLMDKFESLKRTKTQALIVAAVMKIVIFLHLADGIGHLHRVYIFNDIRELTAVNCIFDASFLSLYWFIQIFLFFLIHKVSWEYGHMTTHDDYERRISAERHRANSSIEKHGIEFRYKVEKELRNRGMDPQAFFAAMRRKVVPLEE